jgi:5-oxoprolinase (ATP-hydrolysing)
MSMADVVVEKQEPCNLDLNSTNMHFYIHQRIENLRIECINHLINKENFDTNSIETEVFLNLRYQGTDTGIMCSPEVKIENLSKLENTEFEKVFINK